MDQAERQKNDECIKKIKDIKRNFLISNFSCSYSSLSAALEVVYESALFYGGKEFCLIWRKVTLSA